MGRRKYPRWMHLMLAAMIVFALGVAQGVEAKNENPKKPILTKSGKKAALKKAAEAIFLQAPISAVPEGERAIKAAGPGLAAPTGPTDETKVPHYFGPFPNWANSPFTLPDVAVEILGDGAGAAAIATVGPNGAVTGITITDAGSGYTSATVNITTVNTTGTGTGALANAVVSLSGAVTAINVDTPGLAYTAPQVTISGGGGQGTLIQVGNQLQERQYATDFATPPGTLGPVFVLVPTVMPANGLVQSIQYFNQATIGGSPTPSAGNLFHAYVLQATGNPNEYLVLWDSGELTVPSTSDPVGVVESIPVPDVAVRPGDAIAFYGQGIPVDDLGSGSDIFSYPATNPPPLVGNMITLGSTNFPIYSQTRTYSFAANVIDTSAVIPVTNATATAYGGVDAVTLDTAGIGYTNPTVDFDLPDGPDGVKAVAHAEYNLDTGVITAIVVDQPGSGYSSAPNVVIRDGTLFDPIRNNPGTGATATATLAVQTIVLDTFGAGYTSLPTVAITDSTGTGAGASAVINAGAVTAINLTNPGSGYLTAGGIKKFVDTLPGLCDPSVADSCLNAENNLGQYIPLAVPDTTTFPDADYYVIALVQTRERMSSSLPAQGTLLREYVQLETPANASWSKSVPLQTALLGGTTTPTLMPDGTQAVAVDNPHFLGPVILTKKDRPVRIVFYNLLPSGTAGDLFLPTDSTIMGSGPGPGAPDVLREPPNQGTVLDPVRNPECTEYPKGIDCFKDNRATLHLHGGITPWISDGTPHQWITPAPETTDYPEGVSVGNVPDMANVTGVPDCSGEDDGCQTFYYTNQQSARLLFYHDHAWGITRLNVYAGEAAGYLITDPTEQKLFGPTGTFSSLGEGIPLIIQDRTFVPDTAQLAEQDPTWDATRWGGYGNFWYHHVYMPAQNPGDPGGMSAYGRWMYGPWFWPPATPPYGPIANPYYDPACNLNDPATWTYDTDPFCEPPLIPGTPNISVGMEQFNDTPLVNGTAYPTVTLDPKSYRFRILNAANDRFWNLQWYVGDPSSAADPAIGPTEVALNPAELALAQADPVVFPTPDQSRSPAGPDWIQIGSEGGFLPAPVVVDGQQHTTWITDPTRFDVGNVDLHSLLLASAERADVIVDFSKFAGKTLILYNDAPAAFPARVPSYDYYTGAPDLSPVGAPAILPGYGPNTRTIMQVKIASKPPAAAFNLTTLRGLFTHKANGSGVFEEGQHPIIVGQAPYNSAYGTTFVSSGWCNSPTNPAARCDGYARISDQGGDLFGFNTLLAPNAKLSIKLEPKGIHDEMNSSSFDEFGRMQANIGLEVVPATPALQNIVLYPYVNPPTELIDATNLPKNGEINMTPIASADGTQIWKITHNGVDTHPLHFHLYDVQLLNRVTWDNIIIPPEATELGWKDTVRVSPLEDTIVALRPVIPTLPFELPNSIRPLHPMMPLGSNMGFNNTDAGGNPTAQIVNQLINFGLEYVWHCHILSHEEMDMMRPVAVALPPNVPDGLAFDPPTKTLSWNDNSIAETAYLVQGRANAGVPWVDLGTIQSPLDVENTKDVQRTYHDTTFVPNSAYQYRVLALNEVGYGGAFMSLTVQSASDPLIVDPGTGAFPAAPTNLVAVLGSVSLTWVDNANNESGFVVERSENGGAFASLVSLPVDSEAYLDNTILPGNTYVYRVYAWNGVGPSAYSNERTVVVPPAPSAPTNLVLTVQGSLTTGPRVRVVFRDNQNDATPETGFRVFRSDNGGGFSLLTTLPPRAGVGNVTYFDSAVLGGSTYSYYVVTIRGSIASLPSNTAVAVLPPVPAAPSSFLGTTRLTNGTSRIDLSWVDNSNNESRFVIQRASDAAFTTGLLSFNRGANTLTWAQTGLPQGTTYYYRIAAQNPYGLSAWVNLNPFPITTAVGAAPAAPSNFTGTTRRTNGTSRIDLLWRDNSKDETRFVIQRATNAGFTTNLTTFNRNRNTTTFSNTNLPRGRAYYYRIRAENQYGQSGWVNVSPFPITTP